jgi:hypothetical protein
MGIESDSSGSVRTKGFDKELKNWRDLWWWWDFAPNLEIIKSDSNSFGSRNFTKP